MDASSGARLLIVDDEPDLEPIIRHAFRREIRQHGWSVAFALNGEEALRVVREQPGLRRHARPTSTCPSWTA